MPRSTHDLYRDHHGTIYGTQITFSSSIGPTYSGSTIEQGFEDIWYNASVSGGPIHALPYGVNYASSGSMGAPDLGIAMPVSVPGRMRLRGAVIKTSGTGSGQHQWGLYSYSASPPLADELATGSSSIGSSGWSEIPATGGPIDIGAGNYVFLLKWPASNQATANYTDLGSPPHVVKVKSPYVWTTTPNLTAGWVAHSGPVVAYLYGDFLPGQTW